MMELSRYNYYTINDKLYSPVWGVIYESNIGTNLSTLGIYLRGPYDPKNDPHGLFSPVNGRIIYIRFEGGEFFREIPHSTWQSTHGYKAYERKLGTLIV
jgi:hypothetical protein